MSAGARPDIGDESAEEFAFSSADYDRVRRMLKARAGIELGPSKRNLVYGRLAPVLRRLRLPSFAMYLDRVEEPGSVDTAPFVNALTTNVTEFFRERHHFTLLSERVFPELMRLHQHDKRIRIWSAGCSTGEEPYSLAMTVAESFPVSDGWNVKILATDIDSDVLASARTAIYPADRLERLDRAKLARCFLRGTGGREGYVRVRDDIRRLVVFKQLNLMGEWPMSGPFDVIFCRNVIIYFETATRQRLIERYVRLLSDPGYLFLGHSESLVASAVAVQQCGPTAYRKGGRSSVEAEAA